jgi:LPXTG-site transpeptidase (sortase) family protein
VPDPEHIREAAMGAGPEPEDASAAPSSPDGEAAAVAAPPTRTPLPTRTPAPEIRPINLTGGLTQAPITEVKLPRIRLDSPVVPARLISQFGGTTWEVPPFRVGHGIYTPGAGETGNGVLIGHVSSLSHGNVFRDLDRVRPGDVVQVFSEERGFEYAVTEVKRVSRYDLSMLEQTTSASVTLITCTGVWLADVQDYSERLVVRANLVAALPTPTGTATREPTPTPTAAPSATPEPVATAGEPTPEPSAAAEAPTATLSPVPSSTATPVPPSPTATATPTPVPPTATGTATATACPTTTATATPGSGPTATPGPCPTATSPPPPPPSATPTPTPRR